MADDPLGLVGTTVDGKYRVEELVEVTSLSVVYRAVHRVWRRPVAIKAFMAGELDVESRRRMLASFVREGELLMELSERCAAICQARDVSSLTTARGEWVPFMVLEWLDGETLDAMLVRERERHARPRTVAEAICLLDPVARALAVAHERGIVHRDVKPGNVVVLASGCKLLDFGVASVASSRSRASAPPGGSAHADDHAHESDAGGDDDDDLERYFTPAYGAPEQFLADRGATGPWTDVFALALVFSEIVSGREPLGDGTSRQLMLRSCNAAKRSTPRALGVSVSDDVERVMARALAVEPHARFGTAGEMWSALKRAAPSPWIDLSGTIPFPLQRRRRWRWPWAAATSS
jgi:serine/threonine protein kinase